MQTSSPLPENIVRKLESAIDRLNDDFERVEFWAAALNAFLQPIPRYEAPDSEFLLGHKEKPETGAMEPRERPSARS
jgi:hypothetical protein